VAVRVSDPATFQRLFPAAESGVDASTFINGLGLDRGAPAGRPLVMVNMVATLDGNASFNGRSAPLSSPGDREMFHALRARADAILAGTGTLATERYRPAGKPVITLTRSGHVPTDIPLMTERDGRVILFSGQEPDLTGVAADVNVEPLAELGPALETLYVKYGIRVLLCEGGPGLFGEVIRAGLADEMFLTLSPQLAGGAAGPSVTTGDPGAELTCMRLASVLACESALFLRYVRVV
jgi:riboflavin biosynthesis pyrimidine reductase